MRADPPIRKLRNKLFFHLPTFPYKFSQNVIVVYADTWGETIFIFLFIFKTKVNDYFIFPL